MAMMAMGVDQAPLSVTRATEAAVGDRRNDRVRALVVCKVTPKNNKHITFEPLYTVLYKSVCYTVLYRCHVNQKMVATRSKVVLQTPS